MKNKTTYIIALIIVVVAIGYFIYSDLNKTEVLPLGEDLGGALEEKTDSVIIEKDGVQYEFVEPEAENSVNIPSPSLDRNIPVGAEEIVEKIKSGDDSFLLWNDLASHYQSAGDYTGAEEIWVYTGQKWPRNWLSFLNIANLQAYYLKNIAKAEENYLKTIEIFPGDPITYIRIHEFYRDIVKDDQKALEIIELGIKNNPDKDVLKDFLKEIE